MAHVAWRNFFLFIFFVGCVRPAVEGPSLETFVLERAGVEPLVSSVIGGELTEEAAIQLAFLQSPAMKALLERVGIAQADLIEAGLLTNPLFEVEVRYPKRSALNTNIEYLVLGSLLDLFMIPLRVRVAESELEEVKCEVAHAMLTLIFEVRRAYFASILEGERLSYLKEVVSLIEIQRDLMVAMQRVGNVPLYDKERLAVLYKEASLRCASSETELIRLEEALTRLLGFEERGCFQLPKKLERGEVSLEDVEFLTCRALSERLDVQALKMGITKRLEMLGLKEPWTYTNLFAGVAGELEPEGENLLGFGLAGELPLFNRGHAERMKLSAEIREAAAELKDLEIAIRSEVREAYQLLMRYQEIGEGYRMHLIPQHMQLLKEAERLYNVMGFSIDALLEAKRQEFLYRIEEIENERGRLFALIALDEAIGGRYADH